MFTKSNERQPNILNLDDECREVLQKPICFADENKHHQSPSTVRRTRRGSFRNSSQFWNEKNKSEELKRPHFGERRPGRQTLFRRTGIMGQPEETMPSSCEFSSKRWNSCSSMYCYVDEIKKKSKKLRASRRKYRAQTDGSESTISVQSMQELDNNFKSVSMTEQDQTEKVKSNSLKEATKLTRSESVEKSLSISEKGLPLKVDASRTMIPKSSSKVDVKKRSYSNFPLSIRCEIPEIKSKDGSTNDLSKNVDRNFLNADASVEIATEVASHSKNEIPRRDSLRSLARKLNNQTNISLSELLSKASMRA